MQLAEKLSNLQMIEIRRAQVCAAPADVKSSPSQFDIRIVVSSPGDGRLSLRAVLADEKGELEYTQTFTVISRGR